MDKYERIKQKYERDAAVGKKDLSFNMKLDARQRSMKLTGKPLEAKKTIKRLFKYIAKDRFLLIFAIFLAIIGVVSSLLISYFLKPIIDNYIDIENGKAYTVAERISLLETWLIVLSILSGVCFIGQYLSRRIMLSISQNSLKRMRNDLYDKLERLPISFFDKNKTGDIISRFTNDVDNIGEMLNTTLIEIITGVIQIGGTIFLLIYVNYILGLIVVLATPLLMFLTKRIIKSGTQAFRGQSRALGTLDGYVSEMIEGEKVIKIFNYENESIDEFSYLNDNLKYYQTKAQFKSGLIGPITHQLCNVIYVIVAILGCKFIIDGTFTVGGLTIALKYTRQYNRPINDISMQTNVILSSLASAERVFAIIDEKEEENNGEQYYPIEGNIEFDDVSFGYIKDVMVLKNFSLNIKKGTKIALVGSTGAGKTTITNLLNRFYDYNSGHIYLDGHEITEYDKAYLRRNISYVMQDTHLFTGTIKENILYGNLEASDEDVYAAAKLSCADRFISHLPGKYDTLIKNDGESLSQGERQLLNIARCCISKSPIIVLDEATSSVDTRTESFIQEGLYNLMKEKTTFIVAHRLSTVRKCDLIVVLEHGSIIEVGNHNQLLELKGRYYNLYNGHEELD